MANQLSEAKNTSKLTGNKKQSAKHSSEIKDASTYTGETEAYDSESHSLLTSSADAMQSESMLSVAGIKRLLKDILMASQVVMQSEQGRKTFIDLLIALCDVVLPLGMLGVVQHEGLIGMAGSLSSTMTLWRIIKQQSRIINHSSSSSQ